MVAAFDPESGEERWRYDLAPAYPGHDGSANGAMATPAIADGRTFVLGPWGHLAALDLKTGVALWTAHLVDDLGSEKPLYGFASSPVVVGDTVVLGIGGEAGAVAGFDAATGSGPLAQRRGRDLLPVPGRRRPRRTAAGAGPRREAAGGPGPRRRRRALERRARRRHNATSWGLSPSRPW